MSTVEPKAAASAQGVGATVPTLPPHIHQTVVPTGAAVAAK